MASRVVDGERIPLSLDGNAVLDFCNTRAAWGAPAPREYLISHRAFTIWARESALVTPRDAVRLRRTEAHDPEVATDVVGRAIAVRSALYDVLVGPGRRISWALLAAEVEWASAAAQFRSGRPATWALPESLGLELPLCAVVRAAGELLTSPAMTSVRACPMPDCGWLFADAHGRRTWCSMAWCGNRSKVRRHAERRREAAAKSAAG